MKNLLQNLKKFSTTKILIAFLTLDCLFVQLFVGYATLASVSIAKEFGLTPSFEPLIALVGAVVSEVIGFGIYCLKSSKENTKGGIVYELAMKEKQEEEESSNEGNG